MQVGKRNGKSSKVRSTRPFRRREKEFQEFAVAFVQVDNVIIRQNIPFRKVNIHTLNTRFVLRAIKPVHSRRVLRLRGEQRSLYNEGFFNRFYLITKGSPVLYRVNTALSKGYVRGLYKLAIRLLYDNSRIRRFITAGDLRRRNSKIFTEEIFFLDFPANEDGIATLFFQ